MKHLKALFAGLALTLLAMSPAVARADGEREDLDVTMTVLDSAGDFDEAMTEMDGPDDDDVKDEDWEDEGESENEDGDHDSDHDEDESEDEEEFEDELEDEFEDEFDEDDEEEEEHEEDEPLED